RLSTGGDCLSHHLVDRFPTLSRQAHKDFRTLRCVANLFGSESLELSLRQEHDEDVLRHYHARSRLVSKFRIKSEAELCKEIHRVLQILHWQVDEDFSCHVLSSLSVLDAWLLRLDPGHKPAIN